MAVRASVAAGPDPSAPPQSGTNGPVPEQNRSPERRRGRPNPFALPPPLRKTGPRPSQQHTAKGPFTRRRPPPTPKLQTRNPTPAPLWTSALLQGDRNPPEPVIGIVGMRTDEVDRPVEPKVDGLPVGPKELLQIPFLPSIRNRDESSRRGLDALQYPLGPALRARSRLAQEQIEDTGTIFLVLLLVVSGAIQIVLVLRLGRARSSSLSTTCVSS